MGLDKGAAGQALIGIDRLANLYVVFWITVVTVVLLFMFARSRYGRAVKAIRDDEIAASASGINITYMKVLVFAISAFFAGIAGGIFAQYIGSLNPAMAGWLQSINYVIMVVFGGMGSLTGSIVSAIAPDDPAGAVARLLHLPHARVLGGAGAHHDLPPAGHLRQLGILPDARRSTSSSPRLGRQGRTGKSRQLLSPPPRRAQGSPPRRTKPSSTGRRRQGGAGMTEPILPAEHLGITLRRPARGGATSTSTINDRRARRPHRPERRRQDHRVQPAHRRVPAHRGRVLPGRQDA